MPQGTELQVTAAEAETEAEVGEEAAPLEVRLADALPAETMEALAQVLEDAQTAGEPVDAQTEAVANVEAIKTEIIGDEATGGVLVFTAELGGTEAAAQRERPTGQESGA